jgi:outer membrane protein W
MFLSSQIMGWVFGALLFGAPADTFTRQTGLETDVSVGYAFPHGGISGASGDQVAKNISGMIPLHLAIGYRLLPKVMAGVYVEYGFGLVGSTLRNLCDAAEAQFPTAGVSCSTHDLRLGIQGQYHLQPNATLDPWFGLGAGYEWMGVAATSSQRGVSGTGKGTTRGFEFANLQVGVDCALSNKLAVGPFIGGTLARYATISVTSKSLGTKKTTTTDISHQTWHEWILSGIRAAYVW